MYSVEFDNKIITGVKLINVEKLITHEQIIEPKAVKLIKYIESFNNDDIIYIFFWTQWYFALKKLGYKQIPVTLLDYSSDQIKTDYKETITKDQIVKHGETKNLLTPKSTRHIFYSSSTKNWEPIILLSSLFKLKGNN